MIHFLIVPGPAPVPLMTRHRLTDVRRSMPRHHYHQQFVLLGPVLGHSRLLLAMHQSGLIVAGRPRLADHSARQLPSLLVLDRLTLTALHHPSILLGPTSLVLPLLLIRPLPSPVLAHLPLALARSRLGYFPHCNRYTPY